MIQPRAVLAVSLVAVTVVALLPAAALGAEVVERRRIGRSVEGRVIRAVNVGAEKHHKRILVVGAIHGDERAGIRVINHIRRDRKSPKDFELWLVRNINPDGARRGTRQNVRGVDLNRNFRNGWKGGGRPGDRYYSGPRPFSEPESRAIRDFIKEKKPDITIWYHQPLNFVTKHKRHRRIGRRYAKLTGLPYKKYGPLPGTATRWQNKKWRGHTAFVVEFGYGSPAGEQVKAHGRAVVRVARAW